ncbi:MAG: NADH-quinone oxidoreductase subunit J [Candidatus Latescibacterota bacterium]
MQVVVFYILSAIAILGAVLMVTRKNPLGSAFSLVVSMLALACIYAMLNAEFLFILQILVYAGAIMVLIIFTIMLLNLKEEELEEPPAGKIKTLIVFAASALGCYGFIRVFAKIPQGIMPVDSDFGSVERVGELMMTSYLFPFEIISIVLLVAIVGVVLLAKKVI